MATDVAMIFWQVYGNFIYWEWRGENGESDDKFQECMSIHNSGLLFCMFMILLIGYCFIFAALIVAFLFAFTYYKRYQNRQRALNESKRIMKSIPKEKYSVEKFGEIKDENECIICMSSY